MIGVIRRQFAEPIWVTRFVSEHEGIYVRSKHGFRSLLVATHREGALRYVGELSVGWTREEGAELARRLPALVRPGPIVPCRKQAVWLQPERYCRVRSLGWTHRGRLRGASFAGLIER